MKKDELRRCAICGGNGKVVACDASPEYPDGGRYGSYYVKCEKCGAHTFVVHTRPNAIAEWNQKHITEGNENAEANRE